MKEFNISLVQGICVLIVATGGLMTDWKPSKFTVSGQTFRVFDPNDRVSPDTRKNDRKSGAAREKSTKKGFTHFLSIPLNLDNILTSFYESFQQNYSLIPKNLFIAHKKIHLTLQMLIIPEEEKAVFIKRVRSALKYLLDKIPKKVILEGLDLLNGTKKEAKVVYFKVRNEAEWMEFVKLLRMKLVEEGVIDDALPNDFDSIRIHATLLNCKYANVPYFDATSIFEKPTKFFMEIDTKQVHLSKLHGNIDHKSSYYSHEWIENI